MLSPNTVATPAGNSEEQQLDDLLPAEEAVDLGVDDDGDGELRGITNGLQSSTLRYCLFKGSAI